MHVIVVKNSNLETLMGLDYSPAIDRSGLNDPNQNEFQYAARDGWWVAKFNQLMNIDAIRFISSGHKSFQLHQNVGRWRLCATNKPPSSKLGNHSLIAASDGDDGFS